MENQKLYSLAHDLLEKRGLKNDTLLLSIIKFLQRTRIYEDDQSLSVVLPDANKTIQQLLQDNGLWETEYVLTSTTLSNTLDKLTETIGVWSEHCRERQWTAANLYFQQIKELIKDFDYAEY